MRLTTCKFLIFTLALSWFAATAAVAEVSLPALFSDDMVSSAGRRCPSGARPNPGSK